MSDRHIHVTSFIYDFHPEHVEAFLHAARTVDGGFFRHALPIRRSGDERVTSIVLYSQDSDGISDELAMPRVVKQLAGIFDFDIVIVSAWEGGNAGREYAWPVPGRSAMSALLNAEAEAES